MTEIGRFQIDVEGFEEEFGTETPPSTVVETNRGYLYQAKYFEEFCPSSEVSLSGRGKRFFNFF